MSRNEWESGDFNIPMSEWVSLRNTIVKAWNAKQDTLWENAKTEVGRYKERLRPLRGKAREAAKEQFFRKLEADYGYEVAFAFKEHCLRGKVPKRADFPHVKVTSKEPIHLEVEDLTVVLHNKDKVLAWRVDENNHAVDNAHATWLAKKVQEALRRVRWTRGSGGYCVGNDEYNRDCDYPGGGGNYLTWGLGPRYAKQLGGRK